METINYRGSTYEVVTISKASVTLHHMYTDNAHYMYLRNDKTVEMALLMGYKNLILLFSAWVTENTTKTVAFVARHENEQGVVFMEQNIHTMYVVAAAQHIVTDAYFCLRKLNLLLDADD